MLMKRLVQSLGDKKCVGFSAAMACGSSIEDFESFLVIAKLIYPDLIITAPWTDRELYVYLLYKGKYPGVYFQFNGYEEDNSNLESMDNSLYIRHINYLEKPAILTVASETNPGQLHCVYYDGFKVFDPNPASADGRTLESYSIKEWLVVN